LRLSTAFNPKTDSETEQVNAVLKQYFCADVSCEQDDRALWLPWTKFATNNYQSEITRVTSFYANKSHHPHLNFALTEKQDLAENLNAQEHVTKLHKIHFLIKAEMVFT
jgi:hypothetical protein